jgi:hypothetical protein
MTTEDHVQDNGTAAASFVSTSLDDLGTEKTLSPKEQSERVEMIKDCASVMYGAGSDSVGFSSARL